MTNTPKRQTAQVKITIRRHKYGIHIRSITQWLRVIWWVNYTIPFCFTLFWHIWGISFQLFKTTLFRLRISGESSVPEMRTWSILLIKPGLEWCKDLIRSIFCNFNNLVSVIACWPKSLGWHMKVCYTVNFGLFVAFWEHKKIRF